MKKHNTATKENDELGILREQLGTSLHFGCGIPRIAFLDTMGVFAIRRVAIGSVGYVSQYLSL